ncbi:hypothetical protein AOLI_G00055110 [Acnodon oligacanthus]
MLTVMHPAEGAAGRIHRANTTIEVVPQMLNRVQVQGIRGPRVVLRNLGHALDTSSRFVLLEDPTRPREDSKHVQVYMICRDGSYPNRLRLCGVLESALRGKDETEGSSHPGISRGLVDLVALLGEVFEEHLKTTTAFKGTSNSELLDCMQSVIRERIVEEVNPARFVAIQADETTDVSTQTQLVLVFQYTDGKRAVQEPFFVFIPVLGAMSNLIASVERLSSLFSENDKGKRIAQAHARADACFESTSSFDSTAVREAPGFLRTLQDDDFQFSLQMFRQIMPHVDVWYQQLQKKDTDAVFIKRALQRFTGSLQAIRDQDPSKLQKGPQDQGGPWEKKRT